MNRTPLAILNSTVAEHLGVAAMALAVTSQDNGWCQLLPAGHFKADDGRPHDVAGNHWYIGAEIAARLIAQVDERVNPLVIEYEHQTLNAENNGQPAPP